MKNPLAKLPAKKLLEMKENIQKELQEIEKEILDRDKRTRTIFVFEDGETWSGDYVYKIQLSEKEYKSLCDGDKVYDLIETERWEKIK